MFSYCFYYRRKVLRLFRGQLHVMKVQPEILFVQMLLYGGFINNQIFHSSKLNSVKRALGLKRKLTRIQIFLAALLVFHTQQLRNQTKKNWQRSLSIDPETISGILSQNFWFEKHIVMDNCVVNLNRFSLKKVKFIVMVYCLLLRVIS